MRGRGDVLRKGRVQGLQMKIDDLAAWLRDLTPTQAVAVLGWIKRPGVREEVEEWPPWLPDRFQAQIVSLPFPAKPQLLTSDN